MIRAQDVANAAGVGKTTVSYVFSPEKSHLISPETRKRVMEAANRLGYRPSYLGKALSMKRSYNVALVLPARCAGNISLHLLGIFHGITQCAETSEYNVSVFFGASKRLFDRLEDHRLDGIIVIGLGSNTTLLDRLADLNLPMVVINRAYSPRGHVGCVRSDLAGWFNGEVDDLIRNGCRKLLLLNKESHMDAGLELAELAEHTAERIAADGVKLTTVTMRRDIATQCLELLSPPLQYDGIIINGSEGGKVHLAARRLKLHAGRDFRLTGFMTGNENTCPDCIWYRNSNQLGVRGWQMLERLIAGECCAEPEFIPIVPWSSVRLPDLSAISGFDL